MKRFVRPLCLLLTLVLLFTGQAAALTDTPQVSSTPTASSAPITNGTAKTLELEAEAAILINRNTGKVLYAKNASRKLYPASTTKIMTLLLALENGKLDSVVTVGAEVRQIPGDSSRTGLIVGEKLTLRELLYGLFISSGNDAAMTIGVHISGSVDKFVKLMNTRAVELGCTNTNFTNPHGYHDAKHYTTARDLAIIARAGMKNKTFREIASATTYTIAKNNKRTKELALKTENQFVGRFSSMKYQYKYGTGIKTGYTSKSKHTFVGAAQKDGVELISVVLKTSKYGKWTDSMKLMDYGFALSGV